jgi:hypothetical protein
METTQKINHVHVSGINFKLVSDTIKNIDAFVNANGYQFKDRKGLDNITETLFNSSLINMSKKKRKKLAAYLWVVNNHPTLGGINKFFHFLMKNVLKSDLRVRIIKSEKELAIEAKRKAYKEALEKVKAAYADYKTEKGNFYKNKLAK